MAKITWTCNCPDYTKRRQALIYSRGVSATQDADWRFSTAGIDLEAGEMCKHIMAAKRQAGELLEVPKDIPIYSARQTKDDGRLGLKTIKQFK